MTGQVTRDRLPRLLTGYQVIDDTTDAWVDALERVLATSYGPQMAVQDSPAGRTISVAQRPRFTAKITGSNHDGSYSWQEVYATAAGAWTVMTDGRSGTLTTDQAWEFNKSQSIVTGAFVDMWLDPNTEEWRFFAGLGGGVQPAVTASTVTACAGTTPGTGNVTLYSWNGTTLATGSTVAVLSPWSTSFVSGKKCEVSSFGGAWWLGPVDC